MVETAEQRKSRLAMFANDAVKAKSDYQLEADAVLVRTARLRSERLDREAAIPLGAAKKAAVQRAAAKPRKGALRAKLKASKRP